MTDTQTEWVLCPNCGGAGFFYVPNRNRRMHICMTCKGDGVMSADEAQAIMENHRYHD